VQIRRVCCWLFILPALLVLTACASIVPKPVKPTVELVSIKPLNVSLTEQKLRFDLKVVNPNSFELPIETVDFIAKFNDTNIASGKSNQAITVAANSEAIVSLDVTAGLDRLAGTLQTLLKGESLNLDYQLTGNVEIATWPRPIPFDVIGAMDLDDL